ncbi:hypothetical protein DERP_011703 [Dermatophagoides pteronyssinus]|uniref:Uncharacterized protein n=1 Tax=Dermatophagoides pteronyssinus TaxID=6956 RepID=A0ABQ8J329_DERPT|nr:hypothetical protein DERP_011703 [Dermatophagoides pteronyssinus]
MVVCPFEQQHQQKKPNEVHHHCHHLSRSVVFKYPVPLHDWKHTGNAFQQQQVKVDRKQQQQQSYMHASLESN